MPDPISENRSAIRSPIDALFPMPRTCTGQAGIVGARRSRCPRPIHLSHEFPVAPHAGFSDDGMIGFVFKPRDGKVLYAHPIGKQPPRPFGGPLE